MNRRFIILLVLLWVYPVVFSADATETKPDDMPLPLRMVLNDAYQLFEKQQYMKAVEKMMAFKAGEKQGSDHYMLDFSIGNGWLQQNSAGRAAPFYQSAVGKNPQFSAAWLNLARCRYELSQFKPAAEAFLKGYETSSPKEASTLYYAAVSWFSANEFSRTVQVLERLLRDHPSDIKPEWKETLVHAYLASEKPEKAVVIMEQLINQFSGEKKVQWQEALLYQYLSMNMKKKALSLADNLTRTFPLEPKWWKALAHIHLSGDNHREALTAMTIYGYLQPLSEKEKKLMAELHLMIGIPSKAVAFYRSLDNSNSSVNIIKKIIQSYQMMDQPQEALKWIETALRHDQSTELMMQKAHILYELKQFDKSIGTYETVIGKSDGDTGLAWLMIGFAASQNGNLEKALTAFENASRFKRHQKTALSHLERLRSIKRPES